jgi:hypothetical protein
MLSSRSSRTKSRLISVNPTGLLRRIGDNFPNAVELTDISVENTVVMMHLIAAVGSDKEDHWRRKLPIAEGRNRSDILAELPSHWNWTCPNCQRRSMRVSTARNRTGRSATVPGVASHATSFKAEIPALLMAKRKLPQSAQSFPTKRSADSRP